MRAAEVVAAVAQVHGPTKAGVALLHGAHELRCGIASVLHVAITGSVAILITLPLLKTGGAGDASIWTRIQDQ